MRVAHGGENPPDISVLSTRYATARNFWISACLLVAISKLPEMLRTYLHDTCHMHVVSGRLLLSRQVLQLP